MKQHEREFFIALIRSSKVFVTYKDIHLIVKPLTFDQSVQACEIYNTVYEQGYIDGMMDEDDLISWMRHNDLWTEEDDKKIEGFKKDLEKLKIEIYNARNNTSLKNKIRLYLRAGESQLTAHLSKKHIYYQNTREGIASSEKLAWMIKNSTYLNNELYNFNEVSLNYVVDEWQSSFLSDEQIRELARNEPWKSLWIVRENSKSKLFNTSDDSDLTYNQKNLIVWSQMYDNIQESLDCPNKDVIEDDDMLDGWFIIQSKKREQEKAEKELEHNTKNEKIKNASEVFVMAGHNDGDVDRINSMNNVHAQHVKKQREHMLEANGLVHQENLPDERLRRNMQATNALRGKNGG